MIDLIKRIGDAQGISVPSSPAPNYFGGSGSTDLKKSATWDVWSGMVNQLSKADQPDNLKAFVETYAVLPWMYIGVWIISSSIAARPLQIFEGFGDDAELVDNGDDYDLLNEPNENEDGNQMIESIAAYLELSGNAFLEEVAIINGLPVKLYGLEPYYMNIVPDPKIKIKGYYWENQGTKIEYEPENITHFTYNNPLNQFWGMGVVKPLQTTLITELYREMYNKGYFQNEARPDVVLKQTPDPAKGVMPLIPAAREELALKWTNAFGGSRNARKPVVLPPNFDIELLTEAIQDMAFREMEKSLRERVLGCLGVPPALVGLFEFANYANSREQIKIFHTVTLPPKEDRIAKTITRRILRPYKADHWCKFDTSDIPALREDGKDQTERLSQEYDRGIITLGEFREQRGYGRTDDDVVNDTRVMIQSLVPFDEAGALPEEGGGFEEPEEDVVE